MSCVQNVAEETMENNNLKKIVLVGMLIFYQVNFIIAQFEPDTSINRRIYLLNVKSIKKEIGNVMPKLNEEKDLPDVYFANQDKSQYLRLIFHPGSTNNSFAMFEVGYTSNKIKIKYLLKYEHFYTERNIKLGISRKYFLRKMKKYVKKGKSEDYYFLRLEEQNNPFLELYGLPVYEAKYYFKNDKLIKFYFGFEYP